MTVQATRRLVTGAVTFAVDERGVHLTEDEDRRGVWWNWCDVDAVAHFRSRHPAEEGAGGP
jgi:hypothetical protein